MAPVTPDRLASWKLWISLFIVVPTVMIVLLFAVRYSPAGVQHANMRRADAHIASIEERFFAEPAFKDVVLRVYTDLGGSILVRGYVETQADLDRLKVWIADTKPPVNVSWASVRVYETDVANRKIQEEDAVAIRELRLNP